MNLFVRKVRHILRVSVVLLFENYPSFRDKVIIMEAAGWVKKYVEEPSSHVFSASR